MIYYVTFLIFKKKNGYEKVKLLMRKTANIPIKVKQYVKCIKIVKNRPCNQNLSNKYK